MYCSNCGKQILDNSKFCKFCGYETQNAHSQHLSEEDEKTNLVSSNIMFQDRTGGNIMLLLSAIMLMAIVLCYLLPVVKSKSYIEERQYNIFSLTQDVIYSNNYILSSSTSRTTDGPIISMIGGNSLYQEKEGWNEKHETVSVFEYMYQKSLKTGDASYTKGMYKLSLTFYWIALFIMVINAVLIGYMIMEILGRRNFANGILPQILILEVARTAIIIFLMKSIVKAVPEAFQHYDYLFGGYETAEITIIPFYLTPILLLIILMIKDVISLYKN